MEVVVLRALGLGDLLTAVPALRGVARAFAGERLMLATPADLAPLVELIDPAFAVVDVDFRRGVGRLPDMPCEVAVNLHGRGPDSHRALLHLQPDRLLAFHHREVAESAGAPAWRDDEHEVERWCRMLAANGIEADAKALMVSVPVAPGLRTLVSSATVIHPGAASGARRWPVERWTAIARSEAAKGRRVVVTGGPDEVDLATVVAAGAGELGAAFTDMSVVELAQVVAGAGRVLCGDTGVAHLASATGTPSVVLFGPTSPAQWGPPAWGSHIALWAGGTGDPHAHDVDDGLLAISVSDVVEAIARLDASH